MAQEIAFREATEAKQIAEDLIPQYHLHLLDARVLYLFTTQQRKKCDRVRLGSAQKMSALQKYLSSGQRSVDEGHNFLMMLDEAEWQNLSTAQRTALVDHELTHMNRVEKITDTGVEGHWALRGHDLEEFVSVVERHGLWRKDARDMAKVMQQMTLELEEVVLNRLQAEVNRMTSDNARAILDAMADDINAVPLDTEETNVTPEARHGRPS